MNKNAAVNGLVIEDEISGTYHWPVKFVVPGTNKTHVVELEFYHKGMSDFEALRQASINADEDEETKNIALEIVKGWPQEGDKTFKDKDGNVMPVTEENKAKIFDRIFLSKAASDAFFASQGGKKRR